MDGICPFAVQKLLPEFVNHVQGGIEPRLYVVHVMEGNLTGTYESFLNPGFQASSHFGISDGTDETADGEIWQFVRVTDRAWHIVEPENGGGDGYAIGVETAGWSGNPATDKQILSHARLFEWCHDQFPAIANWRNTRPYTGRGLSWHGLGGQDWGNHPNCPGLPIISQLNLILRLGEDQP